MKNEKLLLFILALIQFCHILDFMIIMPLGKQLMEIFEISPQQFSAIVGSYAISAAIAGFISAMYIDRFDRKQALLVLFVGFTVGTFATAIAPSYELLLMARSLTGAFGGVTAALLLSIIGDVIPLERRGAAMGLVMTAFSVASIVGVPVGVYLAAEFTWQMPFIATGSVAAITSFLIFYFVPSVRKHLDSGLVQRNPLKVLGNIVSDANQLRALSFQLALMFGHFTIIPFIAPYMQLNIGFTDYEITYIYLVGGILTTVFMPLFGRLADKHGYFNIFAISSFFALGSILWITQLQPVAVWIAICATSSLFVVASGRNVPALTMMTSVVKAEQRGSFMSIRSSIQELGLGLSSFLAGLIVTSNADGSLNNYDKVGYIAIVMSIVAVFLARTLKIQRDDEPMAEVEQEVDWDKDADILDNVIVTEK